MLSANAKERIQATEEATASSFKENLKMLFENKIVMLVLLGNILNGLSLTVPAAYFFEHKVTATLFGQENVLIAANLLTVVMRVAAFLVGFEGNRIWISMVLFGIGSIPGSMFGIARTALWGDSIDYMEWKTGKRAEAITFAAQTFCDKISNALNTVIAGALLTFLSYDAEAIAAGAPLSDAFNTWIWPLFMLGPAIGAALYIIPLLFIKYPQELKEQVTRELKERRGEIE